MRTNAKPIHPKDKFIGDFLGAMWKHRMLCLLQDEAGQDLVEYALVAVVMGLGTVVALQGVAGKVITVFALVGSTLTGNT